MKHIVLALVWFLVGLFGSAVFLNCGGTTETPAPAPATDAGNDWKVGSPCAVTQIGDCEIQACWFPDAAPDMVSKRPINDAGPDACEGIAWP